jgi:hypothetical protein
MQMSHFELGFAVTTRFGLQIQLPKESLTISPLKQLGYMNFNHQYIALSRRDPETANGGMPQTKVATLISYEHEQHDQELLPRGWP